MRRIAVIGALALSTCAYVSDDHEAWRLDPDGDGVQWPSDCDDDDSDTGAAPTWWQDADGDGFGDAAATLVQCTAPSGYVEAGEADCDDATPLIHPTAAETCNGVDDDCDGKVDDDDPDAALPEWYDDDDGDGWGDPNDTLAACAQPDGAVEVASDCDDGLASTSPNGTEVCGGADEDCDGLVDDADDDVTPTDVWYRDADGDGYGDADDTALACASPEGFAGLAGDCDEADAQVHPDAAEACTDTVDKNCDGSSGSDDVDQDGVIACDDCNDLQAEVNPGATEACNARDDDCDGAIDDDDASLDLATASAWYPDVDGDQHGDLGGETFACVAPDGYVAVATDCDDADPATRPGVPEVCGGGDEDCDGLADDADPIVADPLTWYADDDADGYGDASSPVTACVQPAGAVADTRDCDDGRKDVSPAGTEVCAAGDEDCDGLEGDADPSVSGAPTWYTDGDKDGYGAAVAKVACTAPTGSSWKGADCNDSDPATYPGAPELCDSIDQNCNGSTLDGQADFDKDGTADCTDTDDDNDGDPDTTDCNDANTAIRTGATEACDSIDSDCDGSLVDTFPDFDKDATPDCTDTDDDNDGDPDASDCNDLDKSVSTKVVEIVDDNLDENCDGKELCYVDADGDTHGTASTTLSTILSCVGTGIATTNGDCNDADKATYPLAPETTYNFDKDCDGNLTCYKDGDADGYGMTALVEEADKDRNCNEKADKVADDNTDCNDADTSYNPGAADTVYGVDRDCDGNLACYYDGDQDGSGTSKVIEEADTNKNCDEKADKVANDNKDCDDSDRFNYPGGFYELVQVYHSGRGDTAVTINGSSDYSSLVSQGYTKASPFTVGWSARGDGGSVPAGYVEVRRAWSATWGDHLAITQATAPPDTGTHAHACNPSCPGYTMDAVSLGYIRTADVGSTTRHWDRGWNATTQNHRMAASDADFTDMLNNKGYVDDTGGADWVFTSNLCP